MRGAVALAGDGRAAEEAALYLCAAGVGRLVLEPALAARMRERLACLNPEVALVAAALDALAVAPDDPERRADGARAALMAVVAIARGEPLAGWQEVPWKA